MRQLNFKLLIIFSYIFTIAFAQKMSPSLDESKNESIKYTLEIQTGKKYYDGNLPNAEGVHHYQVFRSNSSNPAGYGGSIEKPGNVNSVPVIKRYK